MKTVLTRMAKTEPKAATAQPEQFIDDRFFDELEKEGFIQRLWR
jgi:hypothetical protein